MHGLFCYMASVYRWRVRPSVRDGNGDLKIKNPIFPVHNLHRASRSDIPRRHPISERGCLCLVFLALGLLKSQIVDFHSACRVPVLAHPLRPMCYPQPAIGVSRSSVLSQRARPQRCDENRLHDPFSAILLMSRTSIEASSLGGTRSHQTLH